MGISHGYPGYHKATHRKDEMMAYFKSKEFNQNWGLQAQLSPCILRLIQLKLPESTKLTRRVPSFLATGANPHVGGLPTCGGLTG